MTIAQSHYQHIGIIGTGRVAQAFAVALSPLSSAPLSLSGRSADKCAQAIERVTEGLPQNAPAPCMAGSLQEMLQQCDLILIAVSDDAIEDVARQMAEHGPLNHSPLTFHPSGRCGLDVLAPWQAAGAQTAAIHPVMTFTGHPAEEARRMAGCSFAVSSSADTQQHAMALVQALGGNGFTLDDAMRPLYHAALSHAANHLVTVLAGAAEALHMAGVANPYAVMAPLIRAAVENSISSGFDALSGPILRGDVDTIAGHLAALYQYCPEILPDYSAMASATVRELGNRTRTPSQSGADIMALIEKTQAAIS
ncbi:MAG: DUF2520 domain-containing protein [Sphingobium sp.]|nr:DUF2520 domain-containing protein [Sphingobium sp.]